MADKKTSAAKGKAQANRPLSPHLGIYKPQITSVLSIAHRLSGVALFLGVVLFAWWVVMSAYGCARCVNPLLHSQLGQAVLIVWTLALYYHLLNGIRHLFWDMGKGYGLCTATATGWLVLAGTVILTVLTWIGPGLF